jgi:hypothetical protein
VVAPDRSTAILGSEAGDLTVVDLVHLRQLGAVKADLPGAAIFGWGWVARSRLLLIDTSQPAATEVLAVDVSTRRVVRRQRFNGVVQAYARLPRGLALLVTPANAIGRARLVVSDANAGLRTVTLAEINAGFKQFDDTDGSGPRMEQAVPGIAADPAGRRVYVVPDNGPGAEVDVASLEVIYHRLGRSASLLQRLARWWAPPAGASTLSLTTDRGPRSTWPAWRSSIIGSGGRRRCCSGWRAGGPRRPRRRLFPVLRAARSGLVTGSLP